MKLVARDMLVPELHLCDLVTSPMKYRIWFILLDTKFSLHSKADRLDFSLKGLSVTSLSCPFRQADIHRSKIIDDSCD